MTHVPGLLRVVAAYVVVWAAVAWGLSPVSPISVRADDKPAAAAPASTAPPSSAAAKPVTKDELAQQQSQVAAKYKHFEEVILRMAELTAGSDPKRAALLRRAVADSKDQLITLQLERLGETIRKGPLGTAAQNQTAVEKDLAALLELLMSEQRNDRLKDEKERLKEQIRRIKELINRQTQIQGQTQGQGEPKDLSRDQGKLSDDAGKLAQDMKQANASKPGDAKSKGKDDGKDSKDGQNDKPGDEKKPTDDKQPGDNKQSDKPSDDKKPGDSKSGDSKSGQPKDAGKDSKGGESKDSKGQKPSDQGQQSEGQDGEGSDSKQNDQPQDKKQSSQQRVAAAQQRMKDAQKKLDEAKKEGAQKDQEEAIRELEQAKADLEAILRQLREEELARTLAQLEARFKKMLEMQREVYEGTLRLDRVPLADRGTNDELESGRLSRKESLILTEAEKALAILREDGTATAFPEAVEQMRDDMELVVGYLARYKVDTITQGVEEDIIAALEEMIAALQKAQKKQEEQKGKPQQSNGQQSEPPLIDQLAELKMIRALQMRVNTRTQKYNKLVDGPDGFAEKPDLIQALRDLGDRERRIFDRTRDIVTGKNQ